MLSREAPRLTFNVQGNPSEQLAGEWEKLKNLTNSEWTEAIARIAEFEAHGDDFRVNWTRVFSEAVRDEVQFQ